MQHQHKEENKREFTQINGSRGFIVPNVTGCMQPLFSLSADPMMIRKGLKCAELFVGGLLCLAKSKCGSFFCSTRMKRSRKSTPKSNREHRLL